MGSKYHFAPATADQRETTCAACLHCEPGRVPWCRRLNRAARPTDTCDLFQRPQGDWRFLFDLVRSKAK